MKIYERTENGTVTTVERETGLAEINAAMMGETKRTVRTMSSINRTDYAIDYKDGRSVRLVLVDAPAPEGFVQGQAVTVQRPGREPLTGTVAHIHTAPGYVAVLDDKHRGVSTYPTGFVSAIEADEKPDRPAEPVNLQTHTGAVHAPGRSYKQLRSGTVPKCCASLSALARYHFLIPTSRPVTCRRCLAALAKETAK
ncbi:hypothetical protein [Streptomyces sp. NPDC056670]|uniref:hypothetical protein n=1 Tax=Streptomyces sp. NPDC056670 TaxID=3345904 RepID=UPI0036999BD2